MRKLDVFKKVASHLLSQNAAAQDETGCRYRADNGLMCAIGCLITDENYQEEFDDKNMAVDDVNVLKAVSDSLGSPISSREQQMLEELQTIHDYIPTREWYRVLNDKAVEWFDKDLIDLDLEY